MTDKWVLLLRGINVNPTTRVAMADLRQVLIEVGYTAVRTLLQSGNVVFESAKKPTVATIEAAVAERTGVHARAVLLTARELRRISDANPLRDVSDDLSKMVITFLDHSIVVEEVKRPSEASLAPELLVLENRAVYQWCPQGILASKLPPAFWRQFSPVATSRNVRTVDRLVELAES